MVSVRSHLPRKGFTLIELLVVIAIIGILVGLLLPAVQKVREAGNRARCQNNLKQIGIAVHMYHDAKSELPPARIDYKYINWAVILLPYIEQSALAQQWDATLPVASQPNLATAIITPVPTYVCTSRHTLKQLSTQIDATSGKNGSVGDYATVDGFDGSDPPYRRTSAGGMIIVANGVTYSGTTVTGWRSQTSFGSVTDGLSQTLMIGEKHVLASKIGDETTAGDGPVMGGWAYSFMRVAGGTNGGSGGEYRLANSPNDTVGGQSMAVFGGVHGSVNFVWGDGSVRALNPSLNTVTLARLTTRNVGTIPEGDY